MPIRVLSVDDHEVVQLGLGVLFEQSSVRLQTTAKTSAEALQVLGKRQPDVVLTETLLPDGSGIDLLKQIKAEWPSLPVLFFTGSESPSYMARGYASGAAGYVTKSDRLNRLMDVVSLVASGKMAWTEEQLKQFTGGLSPDPESSLTARESDVLQLLAHGLTNNEIAAVLQIGYETVKEHVQHILRKLGVRHRTQAAVWAVRKEMTRSDK